VLFSRYAYTWEGGLRSRSPGGASINSGEARDFLLGGCASALACTACHDPHGEDAPDKLSALAGPVGNALCTKCHPRYAGDAALRAHAHHDPAGAGGACINCHMAKKNMGLNYALTRYHRIGSPTDRARVEGDRPLECALCHADRTVFELVGKMETWWGRHYDRAALVRLYGDGGARPLAATVARGKAHEQATAMAALADARMTAAMPAIAHELVNRYPLVRYFAKEALARLAGRPCEVDLDQDDAEIAVQAARWMAGVAR
jgi:predicted CXXCH cytochrome family protein